MTFVALGMVHGSLYRNRRDTLLIRSGRRDWGNDMVYGALYELDDAGFYLSILDGMHGCSLSRLHIRHNRDLQHRIVGDIITIKTQSAKHFDRLLYYETGKISAYMYIGNLTHPKIKQISTNTTRMQRLVSGCNQFLLPTITKEIL